MICEFRIVNCEFKIITITEGADNYLPSFLPQPRNLSKMNCHIPVKFPIP